MSHPAYDRLLMVGTAGPTAEMSLGSVWLVVRVDEYAEEVRLRLSHGDEGVRVATVAKAADFSTGAVVSLTVNSARVGAEVLGA